MKLYDDLPPVTKYRIALSAAGLSLILLVLSLCFLYLQLEAVPLPPKQDSPSGASNYLVDLTLVDAPPLSKEEETMIFKSIVTILRKHAPDRFVHVRVAAYGEGLPYSLNMGEGLAAYVPEEDLFVVDVPAARDAAIHLRLPPVTWWTLFMGHEAVHKVQQLEGRLGKEGSRGKKYIKDPIEREAFQEGLDLLAAVQEVPMAYDWNASERFVTSSPNPYTQKDLTFTLPEVRVHTAWTVRGKVVHFAKAGWDTILRTFSKA